MSTIKSEVRQFYDQVGWQLVDDNLYQNARYEDLRPVSRQYIHDCHLRITRHLLPTGRYFLDAGSGPIQYPEYLEYSCKYKYRVCADLSITALKAARNRIGDHGLFVVADVSYLPFRALTFDGSVSLHTFHHLNQTEQIKAFKEVYRVLAPKSSAVVVNGWSHSPILALAEPMIRVANWIRNYINRANRRLRRQTKAAFQNPEKKSELQFADDNLPKGTFTSRHGLQWIKQEISPLIPVEIFVWRTITVRFLRALIHPRLGGRIVLRVIYYLEERFPRFFGERGKYPMIVIRKEEEG